MQNKNKWFISYCSIIVIMLTLFCSVVFSYNRDQVSRYANKWASETETLRNPFFYSYPGDCANFVSQAVLCGHLNLEEGGYIDNYYAIPSCDRLYENLYWYQNTNHTRIEYLYGDELAPEEMAPGDVIIFGSKGADEFAHAVIVVEGTGDDIL